jgi:protein SYS1
MLVSLPKFVRNNLIHTHLSKGMIMDWREMAGRPTVRGMHGEERWNQYSWAWSGGKKVGFGVDQWAGRATDPIRGWIIAMCWIIACSAEYVSSVHSLLPSQSSVHSIYYLYVLIRRPRMILDFALTLVFNHLVLTTYYSASIPTSLFFWLVMISGSVLTIIMAEQLCVKREMREGLTVPVQAADEPTEDIELGSSLRRD